MLRWHRIFKHGGHNMLVSLVGFHNPAPDVSNYLLWTSKDMVLV